MPPVGWCPGVATVGGLVDAVVSGGKEGAVVEVGGRGGHVPGPQDGQPLRQMPGRPPVGGPVDTVARPGQDDAIVGKGRREGHRAHVVSRQAGQVPALAAVGGAVEAAPGAGEQGGISRIGWGKGQGIDSQSAQTRVEGRPGVAIVGGAQDAVGLGASEEGGIAGQGGRDSQAGDAGTGGGVKVGRGPGEPAIRRAVEVPLASEGQAIGREVG